jgi:hypothetical protein
MQPACKQGLARRVEVCSNVSARKKRNGRGGRWLIATGLAIAPLLVGCQGAIVGDWRLTDAVPNRQVFSIDNATFRGDGTYSATTTIEGVTNNEKGTYDFNGFKLLLRPQAGGQRSYTASLKLDRLELTAGKRHAVLQKGKKGG